MTALLPHPHISPVGSNSEQTTSSSALQNIVHSGVTLGDMEALLLLLSSSCGAPCKTNGVDVLTSGVTTAVSTSMTQCRSAKISAPRIT